VLAWWGRRWRCCRWCRSFCWFRMDGLLRCLSRWSHSHHHRLIRHQRPFPFPPKTCPSLYLTHWSGIRSTRWWRRSVMVGMSSLDRHPALCPFECAPLTQQSSAVWPCQSSFWWRICCLWLRAPSNVDLTSWPAGPLYWWTLEGAIRRV
jgi:hypothetical protein